jgi:hypothetical protein
MRKKVKNCEKGAKGQRGTEIRFQMSEVRSQKTASPPAAGVKKCGKK